MDFGLLKTIGSLMDYMQVLEYYSITKVQDGEKPLSPEKLPLDCLEFHLTTRRIISRQSRF